MYSSLSQALDIVKSEAGINNDDRNTVLTNDLESSRGVLNGESEYRPYLVAAIAMGSSKGEQTLVRADGDATFRQLKDKMNLQPAIETQLRRQQAIDSQQGTIIPAGWEIQTWLNALCGCKSPGEASGAASANYILGAMVG